MPYIKKDKRKNYDKYIEDISKTLHKCNLEGEIEDDKGVTVSNSIYGELNYIIYSLCLEVLGINRYRECLNYSVYQNIIGMLECVKNEFLTKQLRPYEDIKEEENGGIGNG
jgi:hypothetical protein